MGVGALLTFGYNGGQFNIGGWLGVGEGVSVTINPADLGCRESGAERGWRADGRLGIGAIGVDASTFIGQTNRTAEVTAQIPAIPEARVGFATENGRVIPAVMTNIVAGESAFLGYGGQVYF